MLAILIRPYPVPICYHSVLKYQDMQEEKKIRNTRNKNLKPTYRHGLGSFLSPNFFGQPCLIWMFQNMVTGRGRPDIWPFIRHSTLCYIQYLTIAGYLARTLRSNNRSMPITWFRSLNSRAIARTKLSDRISWPQTGNYIIIARKPPLIQLLLLFTM